jgi:hypothetical protein
MIETIAVTVTVIIAVAAVVVLAYVCERIKEGTPCTYKGFGCAFYDEELGMHLMRCTECPYWEDER